MSYRVLLATADPRVDPEIRDLFSESGEFTVAQTVGTAAALIGEVADREPELVLLHEDLGPAPALAIIRDLLDRRPTLAVVLISRDGSAGMLSAAMEAGARGVVTLPVSYADVQTRLTSAAAWSQRVRTRLADAEDPDNAVTLGRIVAVAGAKGGSGVTTVAAQLALATARSGVRRGVCLVDLDLQAGDVATFFGVTAHHDLADLVDVADELTGRSITGVLFRHSSGVQILPAPEEGERAEMVTASVARRVLGVLRTMFDAVIVDCGSVVSEANLGAVEIADRVLVVSTPDVLSLRGAHRLTRMWDRLQVRKPADCDVLLNRAHRRNVVQPGLARRVVESPLAATSVPARFRRLEEAANTGATDTVDDKRLATAYTRIAHDVGLLQPRTGRRRRRRGGDDTGAVQSVQFALTVPALLVVTLLTLQALLVGAGALVAQRQAAYAARGVEHGRSLAEIAESVATGLPAGVGDSVVTDRGDRVQVSVSVPTVIPGISKRITLTSTAGVAPGTR
jgi:pilus assembly protein CpaE